MSRCNECGYTNPDNVRVCGKCQAPLSINAAKSQPQVAAHQGSGKATVKGVNPNMPYWDANPSANNHTHGNFEKNYTNCPNCTYVLMPDAEDCPNCNWQKVGANAKAESPKAAETPPPDFLGMCHKYIEQKKAGFPLNDKSTAKSTMKLGTFNPMATESKFSLTDNHSQQQTVFEGNDVEVNRANLDANNSAISSKVHARFVCENGVWFIADESTNGATFVQVKGKIALEDGAVLIVGNKILTFKSIGGL
jgi:RNA polymerase subunit RPABC4/transcription elongation factor Spt4